MKIICAGYWKTGTKSMAQALRMLGYKVYDWDDQYFELGKLWDRFHNGAVTDEEIYSSLKDIDVLIDGPVIALWEEIHRVFPDAKIILTTRDEESWYKSHHNMYAITPRKVTLYFILSMLTPLGYKFMRRSSWTLRFCQGIDPPNSMPSPNPRLQKLKFRKHESYVRRQAPKEKLLIHEAKDGWRPLCEFLGHGIPNEPYPYLNKNGSAILFKEGRMHPQLQKMFRRSKITLGIITSLFIAVPIILLFYFLLT